MNDISIKVFALKSVLFQNHPKHRAICSIYCFVKREKRPQCQITEFITSGYPKSQKWSWDNLIPHGSLENCTKPCGRQQHKELMV